MIYALGDQEPDLAGDSWVAPSAVVVGKVRMASNTSMWFGAVARGDNEWIEIGVGSNIQEGCVLHTDPGFPLSIGEDVTVGHQAMLHGCTLKDGCLIGMGAQVLNGAVVGENALIGAGALVGEGKIIPDNALVMGMPGKVIRTLDTDMAKRVRESAMAYQTRWPQFRDTLRKISD